MFKNQLVMTPNEYTQYKWLDAEELRPRKKDDPAHYFESKLLQKVFESLISDNL